MIKRFCFKRFGSRWELPKEKGINIRIVKMNPNSVIDTSALIRIFMTSGYSGGFSETIAMPIAFCPFCGANLFKNYSSEEYVNEIE
jgi:hypothetical protein